MDLPNSEPFADDAWIVQQLRADKLQSRLCKLLEIRKIVLVFRLDVDELSDGCVRLQDWELVVSAAAANRDQAPAFVVVTQELAEHGLKVSGLLELRQVL